MVDSTAYDYSELSKLLIKYTYSQITDSLGFRMVTDHPLFKCLALNDQYYLVFMDSNSKSVNLYDISRGTSLSKIELFFDVYPKLDYMSYQKTIEKFKPINEFAFTLSKPLEFILTFYFSNFPRKPFSDTFINFSTFCENPWFDSFITYNKTTSMFSFPMFNDGDFNACNFFDFNESTIKLRFNTAFSFFYTNSPSESYQYIEQSNEEALSYSNIKENQLIVCFNPILLLEASTFLKVAQVNYYPVILEPNFNLFKYLKFSSLVNIFSFEKVVILYSSEAAFYYNDLINTCKFIIFSTNVYQTDFYFESNISADGYFTIMITRSPKTFNMSKHDDFFQSLSSRLYNDYCGRNNKDFTQEQMQRNIAFLSSHGYSYSKTSAGILTIYNITFPFKLQPVIIFCEWMIATFLKNFSINHTSGTTVFNDKPF